ncbi:MAG: hypothetical protein KDD51_09950 [Bdellovibrionales bacterium]|nr:hypothetical protein [Bdellovibrionales bacterium]
MALGENFLARILPYIVEHGYAAALLGIPSDLPNGYSDKFRFSTEHVADISAVVEYLNQHAMTPIHLVGTSRGSLSAAWAASKLERLYVQSLVLTATAIAPLQGPLPTQIKQPTLLVHHTEDPCPAASYEGALRLKKSFTASPRVGFIGVTGGLDSPPKARVCSAKTAHGFFGKEERVAQAMLDWIEGQTPPPKI